MNNTNCYNEKPVANWKCIWFTLVLSSGYWYLPKRNKWILLMLLYFPYVIIAYYDHWYNCKRNMGPTYLSMFYWWIKPQNSKQISNYKKWCPTIKNKVFVFDFILLIIAALFVPKFMSWNPK